MKLSGGIALAIGLTASGTAVAGGLFLPGSGAVSTSRAGASVASVDDGESIGINPAGIAKSTGTHITLGISAINYDMTFQRNGTYDDLVDDSQTYEGMRYGVVTQDAEPPLGIGHYQPVPLLAIVTDFGAKVPGLHGAAGLYAPNAYPFRRMNNVDGKPYFIPEGDGYTFPAFGAPPPASRYDIIEQEAAVILPSVALAYRVLPDLDIGGRFSVGFADVKSTLALWGKPGNLEEWINKDSILTLKAHDSLVMGWSLGAAYRIGPNIELGASFTGPVNVTARGDAHAVNGPNTDLEGTPIVIIPSLDAKCAAGGTMDAQKGCVQLALPMTAQIGARYKFVDANGNTKGDIELDANWEHWGKKCDFTADRDCHSPGDYRVVVDAHASPENALDQGFDLKPSVVAHGLRDTFGVRLGGSYNIPAGTNEVIVRGGVAYDTAAAKEGWERADFDGAARTMVAGGASFKTSRVRFDAGFGAVLEGTRSTSRNCNPTTPTEGCEGERQGPDPVNPLVNPDQQLESPVNQGTFKSHYLLIMLGASTWF
ncbi:MAG: hypothetical protein HOV81_26590 [Kofleriaceae bacterium]|nr:hypothetical protein [Kofleriaceae bacterium]